MRSLGTRWTIVVGGALTVAALSSCAGGQKDTVVELEDRVVALQDEIQRAATTISTPSTVTTITTEQLEPVEASRPVPLPPDECVVRVERTCLDTLSTDLDGDGVNETLMLTGKVEVSSGGLVDISGLALGLRFATGERFALPVPELSTRASPNLSPTFVGQTDIDGDRSADIFFVHVDRISDTMTYKAFFVDGEKLAVPDLEPLILALPAGTRGVGWIECVDGEDGNPGQLIATTAIPVDPSLWEGASAVTTETYQWDLSTPSEPRLALLNREETTVEVNPFNDVPSVFSCGFGFD